MLIWHMSKNSEAVARFRQKRRLWIIEVLGGKCAYCGSVEDLEADHLDPSTKCFTIANNLQITKARLLVELKKCQLLCGPCHRVKTQAEQTTWKHGSLTGYNDHKCRCPLCVERKNTYQSQWAKQRRDRIAAIAAGC